MSMDRRYMVMQFLGELRTLTPWGTPIDYRVFRCGDDKWFLFDPLDRHGCSLCQQYPIERKRLERNIRRAFTSGDGSTYTTAKRNAFEADRDAHRAHAYAERIRMAALGTALDELHA